MNNTLLDIGENPVQSAGGYGLLLKLKENSQSAVKLLFLTNIVVSLTTASVAAATVVADAAAAAVGATVTIFERVN